MTLDNVQALPLGSALGDYRLDAVIGHGGFGITYRAFDAQLAKIVAIKEYLPVEFAIRRADDQVVPRGARFAEDFEWGRERFLDEARALARFRHPHIVPVLRYIEANGTAYTVMEFEDGRNVAQILREPARRLPPDEVRRLARGLLSGLGAVHAQGFLHRDIKPSNVIIRRDGVPILVDFGAARQAIGGRTRTLTSVLTPQYAPIEQYALDGKQGPWSDIYSAAALLHHAIAGEPPPEAAARVGKDPYRPLSRTQADRYDQAFLEAVDRALAFAPDERPRSVEAWRALFGATLPVREETTTQLVTAPHAPASASTIQPRLGGARRDEHEHLAQSASEPPTRLRLVGLVAVAAVTAVAMTWWVLSPGREIAPPGAVAANPDPSPPPVLAPVPAPPPAEAAAEETKKRLIDEAQRVAAEARDVFERAKDAADAARTLAGEARIVAARAARPGLENVERETFDGASYVGQIEGGEREGLGVLETKEGDRRAGEWKANALDGLAIERRGDGTRYEGRWRDGQANGLGLRETPGIERIEGNFVAGRPEGPAIRRTLGAPITVQAGEWTDGMLNGPGIETVGERERYEGGFRAGRRHGFGQLTGTDQKTVSGRWDDGKLVDSAP